jgi:hypothetical protein
MTRVSHLQGLGLDLGALLRGEAGVLVTWIESRTRGRIRQQMLTITLGAGVFGAAMGYWRDPLQAVYAAVKLPLIVLLTAAGNALLNAMLASLFGLNLTLRQSFASVLISFALASVILGAFSPIVAFLVWNLPLMDLATAQTPMVHGLMLVVLAAIISFAGVTANFRLLQLLRKIGGSETVAWRILFAWLAVNLLLGSQISWILRPFIGAPGLSVEFMRADAFHGSFFETLFSAARGLLS